MTETSATPISEHWTAKAQEWLVTVDHKKIGILYVLMSVVFLLIGGAAAIMMRLQLWAPNLHILPPITFNQFFTLHGTTMVFFVGMPILIGIANYIIPLQIGARDMAFPRLNAFGFWVTLLGGVLVYFSFLVPGGPPAIGWFAYAPLTESSFARGPGVDCWAMGLIVSGLGTTSAGVNFVATILALRCPGMSLRKLPFFTWIMLWTSFQIIIVMPPLTAALTMLEFDRQLGAHFFDTQAGGSAYLWQHLFWFFGHPEVYILVLPAFGMISEVLPVFSRKVLFGYEFMAAATAAIVLIAMGVWAHHMFAVGMSRTLDLFFAAATMLVSIPTGIKIFNWLATIYGGKLVYKSPMLFALGFMSMFVIGGLTGIILACTPIDFQITDTYFVVGHFHWVLIGGTLFGVFSAIHYWYPKATGRMLSERLAKWQFWLLFFGFILTFAPMHVAGILGMPRRIYTYGGDRGWDLWNQLATLGALLQAPSYLIFAWNVLRSLKHGAIAGDDPWDAWTLEWATTSPPPSYNFAVVPTVRSRRPLWDAKHPDDPDWRYEDGPEAKVEPEHNTNTFSTGMVAFLASEVAFFSTLIMAYVIFLRHGGDGPTPSNTLSLGLVLVNTIALILSSVTLHMAEKALQNNNKSLFRILWLFTILLGIGFLAGTAIEWNELIHKNGLTIGRNMFGTTFYTLVGFHAFHVTLGVLALCGVLLATWKNNVRVPVRLVGWYWHFVDVVWIAVFVIVYLISTTTP